VLIDQSQIQSFVDSFQGWVQKAYPTLTNNPDYTGIVNPRHEKRLHALLDDARAKGAKIITINPGGEDETQSNGKIFPTLVLNVTDNMSIMKEEIFGPLLPIRAVPSIGAAIDYINARPRPLALYYFDNNGTRVKKVLKETISGGAVINDVLFHVVQEDLPFGGVGASGMGNYHGEDGFKTFSHEKAVLHQAGFATTSLFSPPYGSIIDRLLSVLVR
jgi:acyl-CoA reductase-like NAD-dependent aldehyde dehydrogenase